MEQAWTESPVYAYLQTLRTPPFDMKRVKDSGLYTWRQLADKSNDELQTVHKFPPYLSVLLLSHARTIPVVDEIFPAGKCFYRIVICRRYNTIPPTPISQEIQRLIDTEIGLISALKSYWGASAENKSLEGKAHDIAILLGYRKVPFQGADGERRLAAYLGTLIGPDATVDTENLVYEQARILKDFALYPKDTFQCVALDKNNYPLYWLSVKHNRTYNVFYIDGFARSFFSPFVNAYTDNKAFTRNCGAPFFSYIVDKMMHDLVKPKNTNFYITALEGTQKVMLRIEEADKDGEEWPLQLFEFEDYHEQTEEIYDHLRTAWDPKHVYLPTEEFMNAWKRAVEGDEGTKKQRLLECSVCCIRDAEWTCKVTGRVFCDEQCFDEFIGESQ